MRISLNLRGVNDVVRNANKMMQDIEFAVKSAMVESAIVDIETGAKLKITQDRHIDTGRLRASIHASYSSSRGIPARETYNYSDLDGRGFTSRLQPDRGQNTFQIKVGTDVEYAVKIENLDTYLYYAFQHSKASLKARIQNKVRRVLGR